jgi:lipoprotein-anchoring transpeptidase ErfK/SrfK
VAKDYYPVLSNAIAALDPNSEAARRSVYDRARRALVGLQPTAQLSPAEMSAETAALETAIRRIEAEQAGGAPLRRRAARPGRPPPSPAYSSRAKGTHRRGAVGLVPMVLGAFILTAIAILAAATYAYMTRQNGPIGQTSAAPPPRSAVAVNDRPKQAVAEPATSRATVGDLRPGVDGGSSDPDLPYIYRRQLVFYRTANAAGMIVIEKSQRFLYFVRPNNVAMRYGIGIGDECLGSNGLMRISNKVEWPEWRAPDDLIKRQPNLPRLVAGGPGNPLGARVLYLGDNTPSIHGTNAPKTIGTTVTLGCFRMVNDDVIDLYNQAAVEGKVLVRN